MSFRCNFIVPQRHDEDEDEDEDVVCLCVCN